MEPDYLHILQHEMGISVDAQTLQNPTEDFMITLITEYLKKFYFDGFEISKSTEEQLNCLSCPDSATDAIKIINLHSALSSICNEIFIQDFFLTDISSPGSKRTKKHMKILFNFLAYVKDKMVENESAFIELDNQQKAIEELFDKKESTIARIGATIHDRENKLELMQKYQDEINTIQKEIEINNKQSNELEKRVKDVMLQHQETLKKYSDLKAKAVKLHKETSDLQSKIVKSPEEYAARSKELQNLLEIKKEERQALTDSISRKKLQIKNNENAQELVKNLNDKFSTNSSETFTQLKITSEKLEHVQKELELLKKDIAKWSSIEKNSSNSTNEDFKDHHEDLLVELENQYKNKERELMSLKTHLDELNADLSKKKNMLDEEMKTITINQETIFNNSKQYTEYLKYKLSEEDTLRQDISKSLS